MSTLWAQARQSFRGWDPRAPWDIGSGSRVEAEEGRGGGGGGEGGGGGGGGGRRERRRGKKKRKEEVNRENTGRKKGRAPSHDPPGLKGHAPWKPGSFLLWECYQDIKGILKKQT